MARPTKLTTDIVKKLEYAFSIGATIEEACYYADISRQSYYNWMEQYEELFDRFERFRQEPIFKARLTVVKALETNPLLAFKYLERKKPEEFGLRATIDDSNSPQELVAALMQQFDEPH